MGLIPKLSLARDVTGDKPTPTPSSISRPRPRPHTRAILAGILVFAVVLLLVLALLLWRRVRRVSRERRIQRKMGLANDRVGDVAGPNLETWEADRKTGMDREGEAPTVEDVPMDYFGCSDDGLISRRTTIVSDAATVGGPSFRPPSYAVASSPLAPPPLPPAPPLRAPPSAFFTRRRQARDGGVRLGGWGFSLRRFDTMRSDAASSVYSASTLPPPYQARY